MELEEMIQLAKQGDKTAVEELRKKHIKIWTYEQLKALNTFRQNRNEILKSEKVRVIWASPLRRDFYSDPEMAFSIYAQRINDEYKLLKVSFEDQTEQYWIVDAIDGEPICPCTEWVLQEEKHGRTKEQLNRLDRYKKRWSEGKGRKSKPVLTLPGAVSSVTNGKTN